MTVMTNSLFWYSAGWLAVGLSATLLAVPAAAESEPFQQNGSVFATGRSALLIANCSQARDVTRCLAMQQARQSCQAKRGTARRHCLLEKMPAPDCAKAPDPRRCLALQEARLACQGKLGKAMRRCLRNYTSAASPPPPIANIN